MKLKYRSDIDGLRAIAVLSVILNHAGFTQFRGGFIGVDVFFVISGYLITTIILNDINENRFSIFRFYERRIRRIFPALFVILLFTLLVSAVLYDADSFAAIGKSITATTLFYSNFLFWREAGYFEAPSQLKPLLHTWSLAVEEQFYIVFPLLLWALMRAFRKKTPYILVFLATVSLGLSVYTTRIEPTDAFYLPHLRAWELLTGSILSLSFIPALKDTKIRDSLSVIGLVLILYSVFQYSEKTLLSGLALIVPVLGTALIIYSGAAGKTLVGRLLELRPVVFVGLISYSLYLWHWLILVFAKYYAIRELTQLEIYGLLLVMLVMSTLSWRFVEQPFRVKPFLIEGKKLFTYAGIIMVVFIASGVFVAAKAGMSDRNNLKVSGKSTNSNGWQGLANTCKKNEKYSLKPCNLGAKDAPPSFVLWGDSFALAQAPGVHLSAEKYNIAGQLIYAFRCSPLLGINREDTPSCIKTNSKALKYIEDHLEIKTIILVGKWAIWAEGNEFNPSKSENGKIVVLSDGWSEENSTDNTKLFKLGLRRTVEALLALNRKVVIVSQVPEVGYDVPSAYSIAKRTGRDVNKVIAPTLEQYLLRSRNATEILNTIDTNYDVTIIDIGKALCNEKICRVVIDEEPLYKDGSHLSFFGAEYLSFLFDPIFENQSSQ